MSMIDFRRSLGVPDFARMNLPEQFWRAKVHNVPESVRKSVAKYLLNTPSMVEDGIGLLVVGQKGVGKTGIAALVAKESRARGYTVFFTSVWEMREMIRAKARFDDEMSMVDRARLVDVLILDELRPEDIGESWFGRAEIEALVASRAAAKRVTVMTTRMSPMDLKDPRNGLPNFMDTAQGCMVTLPVTGPNLRDAQRDTLRARVLVE